jgi:hypothetical protein
MRPLQRRHRVPPSPNKPTGGGDPSSAEIPPVLHEVIPARAGRMVRRDIDIPRLFEHHLLGILSPNKKSVAKIGVQKFRPYALWQRLVSRDIRRNTSSD